MWQKVDSVVTYNWEQALDHACYWSGTSIWQDLHGAGAQRSDPKNGDPADDPEGHGPQGDTIRIFNHVRVVRGGNGPL